jgi:hypothetical protein
MLCRIRSLRLPYARAARQGRVEPHRSFLDGVVERQPDVDPAGGDRFSRRHSSIGYLSPIDYERLHPANPVAHQPAAVLAQGDEVRLTRFSA